MPSILFPLILVKLQLVKVTLITVHRQLDRPIQQLLFSFTFSHCKFTMQHIYVCYLYPIPCIPLLQNSSSMKLGVIHSSIVYRTRYLRSIFKNICTDPPHLFLHHFIQRKYHFVRALTWNKEDLLLKQCCTGLKQKFSLSLSYFCHLSCLITYLTF